MLLPLLVAERVPVEVAVDDAEAAATANDDDEVVAAALAAEDSLARDEAALTVNALATAEEPYTAAA